MMNGENFFPMNIPNDIQRALSAQFNKNIFQGKLNKNLF